MTGEAVHQVFEAILPQEAIDRFCRACGVITRRRTRRLGMLVRAMVIAAGAPGGAYQADILRSYLAFEVPQMARSAFYRWFDEPLERFMAALAEQALACARTQQVDLSGLLGVVKDWSIVDSPTVTVRNALREEVPGAGAYAARKGHTVRSVGCGAPVHDHVSPARDHDSRHLESDGAWQGCGLLADLAYASLARLRACNTHGVRLVIRLQDHWKPRVDSMARGRVTQECFPGTDRDVLLQEDILQLDGRAIAADAQVGRTKDPIHLRLIGIPTPKGYGFFLTNLPPRIGPRQVADLSRVRWDVALSSTLDKSVHRLDQIAAERPCSVQTLLHASLIASMIAALLAHTHTMQTRPLQEGTSRTEAPRHPRRFALPLAVSCQSMAQAFALKGVAAKRRWQEMASLRMHSGNDPNWRRRPAVLEQLRGWQRQPAARKQANRGHLKAVA